MIPNNNNNNINMTPLQQFMAATMANRNVVVLVSDSAKTRLPESFRNQNSLDSSSSSTMSAVSSPRRKMNPDACRWGETSSADTPSSPLMSIGSASTLRRASDSALVLPKNDTTLMAENDTDVLPRRASSDHRRPGLLTDDSIDELLFLVSNKKRFTSPKGGSGRKRLSPPTTSLQEDVSSLSKANIPLVTRKQQPTAPSSGTSDFSPIMNGGDDRQKKVVGAGAGQQVMDLKGQAIIETVIALSRKAAITITRDQATCSSRSALSA